MPTTLSPGLKSTRTLTVTPDVTADAVGSGLLPVFSTPSMIAFIELAASERRARHGHDHAAERQHVRVVAASPARRRLVHEKLQELVLPPRVHKGDDVRVALGRQPVVAASVVP